MKRKVIFLDRDGTIIEDKIYLNNPEEVFFFPMVFKALQELRDLGFEFIIVTNQSGIARGLVDLNNLRKIHRKISYELACHGVQILFYYYAPFLTIRDHYYRKPMPGMILEASFDYNVNLEKSWMIGDKITDVEAGNRSGLKSILINKNTEMEMRKKREKENKTHFYSSLSSNMYLYPVAYVQNLWEATLYIQNEGN